MDTSQPLRGDLYAVGKAVGLAESEALTVARHLQGRGWLRFDQHTEGGRIWITLNGVEEIERLQLPWWRRWLTDPSLWSSFLGGLIVALVAGVLRWLGM